MSSFWLNGTWRELQFALDQRRTRQQSAPVRHSQILQSHDEQETKPQINMLAPKISSSSLLPEKLDSKGNLEWDVELLRILCSILVTKGQNINLINQFDPFKALTREQIESQIKRLLLQQTIGELDDVKYDPYRLSKFNYAMVTLLTRIGHAATIDAKTGRLITFPNYEGGFHKNPKYQELLKAKQDFVKDFMAPQPSLTKLCTEHLEQYLQALEEYTDYKPAVNRIQTRRAQTTDAQKVVGAGLSERDAKALFQQCKAMNATVEHVYQYNHLKKLFGKTLDFNTLMVHDEEQDMVNLEFAFRMSTAIKEKKDEVLKWYSEADQLKIKQGPTSKEAKLYYQRLELLASDDVRRLMLKLDLRDKMDRQDRKQGTDYDEAFEWLDGKDTLHSKVKPAARRRWLQELPNFGARYLADVFYQSKPKLGQQPPKNTIWERDNSEESFEYLRKQMVPATLKAKKEVNSVQFVGVEHALISKPQFKLLQNRARRVSPPFQAPIKATPQAATTTAPQKRHKPERQKRLSNEAILDSVDQEMREDSFHNPDNGSPSGKVHARSAQVSHESIQEKRKLHQEQYDGKRKKLQ